MMGIRKKLLNGLASWILKQIPADKPSQASDSGDKATRNKVGSENQKDGAITAAADKLDDGLIVEASLAEGKQELLGLPLNETAKNQLEQHVATNYEKPTQNNQSKSSVSQTDSEDNADSSKIKLRLEEEQQQAEVQRRKQEAERLAGEAAAELQAEVERKNNEWAQQKKEVERLRQKQERQHAEAQSRKEEAERLAREAAAEMQAEVERKNIELAQRDAERLRQEQERQHAEAQYRKQAAEQYARLAAAEWQAEVERMNNKWDKQQQKVERLRQEQEQERQQTEAQFGKKEEELLVREAEVKRTIEEAVKLAEDQRIESEACNEEHVSGRTTDGTRLPRDLEAKPELISNSLNGTQLIDILELPDEVETKLKEKSIYRIDDLELLSLHEIKKLLDYDEDSLTELMASLLLKGCRVPTFTEKAGSESTKTTGATREDSELIRITTQTDTPAGQRFLIPGEPIQSPGHEWIPKDSSIVIADTTIQGGLIYVGKRLPTITGDNDPCLIDPTKEVALSADFKQRLMGYWPSYSNISAEARRAYLNWLAAGKDNPGADIGYVFLYFYGLERRIIIDNKPDANNKDEILAIASELRRLLYVYGKGSKSFSRYATDLLDWIGIIHTTERMYKTLNESELLQDVRPQSIRLALGQAAIDNVCLPAVVALHWARLDTNGTWTTKFAKNPVEFYARFQKLYKDVFGDGLQLQTNDQELRFNYVPASSSLKVRAKELVVGARGIPNIKISTDIKRIFLGILGQTCQYLLEPYAGSANQSAHTIDAPDTANTLSGSTWSEATLERLRGLKEQAGNGPRSIRVKDLAVNLGISIADTKTDFIAFSKLLSQYSLFIIPDVKSGASPPRADDQVVIYLASPISGNSQQSAKFNAANIALQLASAVAASDGEFSDREHEHLLGKLKGWSHLDDNQILHLEASLSYLKLTPAALNSVKLNQIKKKLEHLDQASRRSIAEFIALVAQVDGAIMADEIKALEKVYKVLNLDCGTIYSDLHNGAIKNSSLPSSVDTKIVRDLTNDLGLDANRIAQLQQDTDRGADLLAAIFSEVDEDEQASVVSSGQLTQEEGPEDSGDSLILGLDNTLSIFACQLMERLSWSRSDLLIVAKELGLMLDGALESINEASYDKLDLPFSEGDDPVEINPDALSRLNS